MEHTEIVRVRYSDHVLVIVEHLDIYIYIAFGSFSKFSGHRKSHASSNNATPYARGRILGLSASLSFSLSPTHSGSFPFRFLRNTPTVIQHFLQFISYSLDSFVYRHNDVLFTIIRVFILSEK